MGMSEYTISTPKVSPDTLISLLKTMTLIRRFEEKIVEVYPVQDMKSPVHLYIGEEAVATAVCAHLTRQDYIFTTHRSHGHCLAKGVDPAKLYAEFYGRITGCCKGKGGSMHPADPEHGILGTSAIVGGIIPKEYIKPIDKGIQESAANGVIAGYPLVDFQAAVFDGSYHEVDSSEMAFKIAASKGLQDAVKKASPIILEPIMKVEVIMPETNMGDVIGDLNSKRAQINEMTDRLHLKVIDAFVPLAEMFGYATSLRSMTQGQASYTMEFDHYAEVPRNIAEKIIESRAGVNVRKGM